MIPKIVNPPPPKRQQLSPQATEAFEALKKSGRVRTTENISRLCMIELKAFGLAEDPVEDTWQLTEAARALR
jgi:hypothetical protein